MYGSQDQVYGLSLTSAVRHFGFMCFSSCANKTMSLHIAIGLVAKTVHQVNLF